MKKVKFEQALEKLEEIVDKLETGELDLEESIKLYEEGIGFSLFCQKQLYQADGKIQHLMKKLDGEFELIDIDMEQE